ncbi:hypothetical protein Q4E93_20475 [Flavitalea sp. BT771]|uniref:hypothetical protein n=1 Tax=Flavitalea sp. BT771 TaxID=3063329 RepID=UPI0026E346C4|nr:hypothetical protein [Flavitalea sp. BT771]MDO6432996.1 hypothetical protein [Flavitalea sp. BT771]MDV6221728.1 hypothetical protein [Flavitalea sp. BT771]
MRTQLHLTSTSDPAIAGPEAEAFCLIYSFLLHACGLDHYKRIDITLVGADKDEGVTKYPGKKIAVATRYSLPEDLAAKGREGRSKAFLEVIHAALLRVAALEYKLDAGVLESIRKRMLHSEPSFEFACQSVTRGAVQATLRVHADMTRLDYYVLVVEGGRIKFKLWIYSRSTSGVNVADVALDMTWKDDNELVISGKSMDVEIHVLINEGRAWSRRVPRNGRVRTARKVVMA